MASHQDACVRVGAGQIVQLLHDLSLDTLVSRVEALVHHGGGPRSSGRRVGHLRAHEEHKKRDKGEESGKREEQRTHKHEMREQKREDEKGLKTWVASRLVIQLAFQSDYSKGRSGGWNQHKVVVFSPFFVLFFSSV